MTTVEHTEDILAPIDEVFVALTDPRRTVEWNPNIIEVSGVEYPIGVGSTWRQVTMIAGRPASLTCRVVRFEPPRLGELEISGDQQGRTWTHCDQLAGATRVTQGIEFAPPGGKLGQMAAGLVRPALHRELVQTMYRQRALLEDKRGGAGGTGTA